MTEVNESISTDALKGTFEETTSAFQLAASVAEFAEILRGSFWAQEGSLELVREALEGVLPHIDAKLGNIGGGTKSCSVLYVKHTALKNNRKDSMF